MASDPNSVVFRASDDGRIQLGVGPAPGDVYLETIDILGNRTVVTCTPSKTVCYPRGNREQR